MKNLLKGIIIVVVVILFAGLACKLFEEKAEEPAQSEQTVVIENTNEQENAEVNIDEKQDDEKQDDQKNEAPKAPKASVAPKADEVLPTSYEADITPEVKENYTKDNTDFAMDIPADVNNIQTNVDNTPAPVTPKKEEEKVEVPAPVAPKTETITSQEKEPTTETTTETTSETTTETNNSEVSGRVLSFE